MQDRMIEETRQSIQQGADSLLRSGANRAERRANRRRSETENADQRRAYRPRCKKMKR